MSSSYLYVNDIRVHYLTWGAASSGRPVILVHGLASNARIWEKVAPFLVDAGYALYALDLRGHGLTDKPEGDYGFSVFNQDLNAFMDALSLEKPLLVGHSWGAMLVLDQAARFQVGLHAPAGIVLVDGGMTQMDDLPGATWEQVSRRLAPPHLAGTPVEDFVARVSAGENSWRPDDQDISIILANFEISAEETVSPHLSFDHHMKILRSMWEFKTYERFARLRCPVLLVPAVPAGSLSAEQQAYLALKERGIQRAYASMQKLSVERMLDSIHDVPLQHPDQLAEIIIRFAQNRQ
jgi:pimeloyl-ACP methyl ester carboxylesterase